MRGHLFRRRALSPSPGRARAEYADENLSWAVARSIATSAARAARVRRAQTRFLSEFAARLRRGSELLPNANAVFRCRPLVGYAAPSSPGLSPPPRLCALEMRGVPRASRPSAPTPACRSRLAAASLKLAPRMSEKDPRRGPQGPPQEDPLIEGRSPMGVLPTARRSVIGVALPSITVSPHAAGDAGQTRSTTCCWWYLCRSSSS